SGLLLKSFKRLLSVNPGFRAENVLVARLQAPYPRYGDAKMVRSFYDRVLERVATIPGVRSVGLTPRAPLTRGKPQNKLVARRSRAELGKKASRRRGGNKIQASQWSSRTFGTSRRATSMRWEHRSSRGGASERAMDQQHRGWLGGPRRLRGPA